MRATKPGSRQPAMNGSDDARSDQSSSLLVAKVSLSPDCMVPPPPRFALVAGVRSTRSRYSCDLDFLRKEGPRCTIITASLLSRRRRRECDARARDTFVFFFFFFPPSCPSSSGSSKTRRISDWPT